MLRVADFYPENVTPLETAVTDFVAKTIVAELHFYDKMPDDVARNKKGVLPSDKIRDIDIKKLVNIELDSRHWGLNRYAPKTVPSKYNTMYNWFKNAVEDLSLAIDDKNSIHDLSIDGQYLMIMFLESYIDVCDFYNFIGEEIDSDRSDFENHFKITPDEYIQNCIEAEINEIMESELEEDEELRDSDKDIREWVTNAYTDIRCWINYPAAPECYDIHLLAFEDEDYKLLDDISREYLVDSGMAGQMGIAT